jgi:multicomponent Na+:H+ antiporter subunit G
MDFLQELTSTIFIVSGAIFIIIASLGILKLPDFYIRMSAITKAGTMGVGLIAIGITIYFNQLSISIKAFVIISFMMVTAPVAAHIIARAAYRQGIPFWGKNLIDELNEIVKKRDKLEELVSKEPNNISAKLELINCYTALPPVQGGSLKKAVLVADDLKEIDLSEGHRALGMIYARDLDYKLAEAEYVSAIEASGGQVKYKYELGVFYREVGWYEKSFEVLEAIATENPDEVVVNLEIGRTALNSGLHLDRAEKVLNSIINRQSEVDTFEVSEAYCLMGRLMIKRRNKLKAKEFFGKAVDFNPDNCNATSRFDRL